MFRIKTDIRQYKCESPDKVEKLIRNWVIRPTDLIFSPENADWHPIGDHPVFTPLFDMLNEQLKNEPDTLVTRNPFTPPTAPDGVELSRADTDEITTMTRRTLVLRSDSDDTTEMATPDSSASQDDEPPRKIGRHDLPEELFATAEIHGTFSRDGTPPLLDELAELSEKVAEESTMVIELETTIESDTPTTLDEIDVQDDPTQSQVEINEDPKNDDLVETTEATAFERTNPWPSPVPEENDDDLILAQDFSTTSQLAPSSSPDEDTALEAGETQEFNAPDDTNISQDAETADFEIPAVLLASSKNDDDSEKTENTDHSNTSEQSDSSEDDEDSVDEATPEIPEGYTVKLPPIGPSEDDLAIGIKHSTRTDEEKERIFHTPTSQPMTTVIHEDFILRHHATNSTSTTTLDLPAPALPDNKTNNKKATTYIVAAIVTLLVVAAIIALAT